MILLLLPCQQQLLKKSYNKSSSIKTCYAYNRQPKSTSLLFELYVFLIMLFSKKNNAFFAPAPQQSICISGKSKKNNVVA